MKTGYQGEPHSYSDTAAAQLFPGGERHGFETFAAAFEALRTQEVDQLVLPIENSTTGSVLPVLDRLVKSKARIVKEHLLSVRHVLMGHPGATLETIKRVKSHPEALSQAQGILQQYGWQPIPSHDTAGAVKEIAKTKNLEEAALAPEEAAAVHGLTILKRHVTDRADNTTRFVVLETGGADISPDANKTTVAFETAHTPGALALALTELGLRGANLTRIESRPGETPWQYIMFVDLLHLAGPKGYAAIFDPHPLSIKSMHHLGTYQAASQKEGKNR